METGGFVVETGGVVVLAICIPIWIAGFITAVVQAHNKALARKKYYHDLKADNDPAADRVYRWWMDRNDNDWVTHQQEVRKLTRWQKKWRNARTARSRRV